MDFPPPPPRPQGSKSSSGGCLKWGLIGCGGGLGLFLIVAFVMGWYISRHAKDIAAATDQSMRDGIAQARHSDEKGCVDAATKRMEKGSYLTASVQGSLFLAACLRSSQPTAGFCDGVPRTGDFTRTTAWQQQRCSKDVYNPGSSVRCQAVGSAIQRYCADEGRPKESPDAALTHLDSLSAALKSRGRPR